MMMSSLLTCKHDNVVHQFKDTSPDKWTAVAPPQRSQDRASVRLRLEVAVKVC